MLIAGLMLGFLFQIIDSRLMECLVKTCSLVRLTLIQSLLGEAHIPYVVFDQHISALEGGIGAFPRRVMVTQAYLYPARRLLADEGQLYND